MALLIGRYQYSLDGKNRLSVPPKFREALKAEKGRWFYLASGFDKCLYLYLPSQWNRFLGNDLQGFAMADKENERAMKRKFFSEATEAPLDTAGRILVPQYLKQHAKLRGQVLVQGAGQRAEIWDYNQWNSYNKKKIEPTYRLASKSLEV